MATIWKIVQTKGRPGGELWIPVKVYDETNTIVNLCDHNHKSRREAERCLTRALPKYMKHQRKQS